MFAFMKRDDRLLRRSAWSPSGCETRRSPITPTALGRAGRRRINKLTLNPRPESNVGEGVLEVASELATARVDRPVLVVLAISGGQSGVDPRTVLDKVRQSGVTMAGAPSSAAASDVGGVGTMTDQSGREQILGDGPKQSGGRRIEVPSTGAFPKAMLQVADDLLRAVRRHLHAARRGQAGQAVRNQLQAQGSHAARAVGDPG